MARLTNGNVFNNFSPNTFKVTIPAKTGENANLPSKWYGSGTYSFAPPTNKYFTPALSGVFSVSATKRVHFSQGNLYADSEKALHFEANQYSSASSWDASHVSLFAWSSRVNANSFTGDYLFCDESHKVSVDGGEAIYYALSIAEWQYLINKNGSKNIRKDKYKYGVTVCDKTNCLILAPDDFEGTIAASYDATAWASAEAAGLVCLPAAGYRENTNVYNFGSNGYYWSSSAYGTTYAYFVGFDSNGVSTNDFGRRFFSVRLVTEAK